MATGVQSSVADLLVHITADTFGQVPSMVLRHIIDAGPLTLDQLLKRMTPTVDQCRHGLLILLHHQIVDMVYEYPTGHQSNWTPPEEWPQDPSSLDGVMIKYRANYSAGLARIRYPRSIDMVHELLGFHVAVVLKVILQQGMATFQNLQDYIQAYRDVSDLTLFDGLPEAEGDAKSMWMDQMSRATVDRAFKTLIDRDYIQRVPSLKELAQMCYERQRKEEINKIAAKASKSAKAKGRAKAKAAKLTASEENALSKSTERNMDDIFLTKKSLVARRGGPKKSRLERRVEPVSMKASSKAINKPSEVRARNDDTSANVTEEPIESEDAKRIDLYRVNMKAITFDLVKLTMEDLICVRFVAHEERVLLRLVVRTLLQHSLRLRSNSEVTSDEDMDSLSVQEVPIPFLGHDNNFLAALNKKIASEERAGRIDEIDRSNQDEWSIKIGSMLHDLSSHPDGTVMEQIDSEATSHGIRWERVKTLLKRRLLVITLRRMIGTSAARVWNGMIQHYPDQYVTDVEVADLCLVSQAVARASLYALENLGLARAQSTDIVQSRQSNLKQATAGGWVYQVDETSGYQRGFSILISSMIKLFERREFELRKINALQNDTSGSMPEEEMTEEQRNIPMLQEMAEYAEDMLETYILLLDEHLTILNLDVMGF